MWSQNVRRLSTITPKSRTHETVGNLLSDIKQACAAEMAVRYAALRACHCNSLGGAMLGNDHNGTDGQTDRRTDRQTDRVRRNMRPPPREEGRIIIS